MPWVVDTRIETKGNTIIFTSEVSALAKIDSLMAAFNAIVLVATNPGRRSEA
jgi:phage terminase large subunit-like protein